MAANPLDDRPQLRIRRTYPVAAEKVWRAWTEPQALSQWFGPGAPGSVTRAEMDVRPGGRYRIAFHTPDGEQHDVAGVYREVVLHRKLAFTWAWNSTPERVSLVTIELQQVATGTQLSFLHENFFDLAARDNHERGWNATFAKLDALLAEAA